MISFKGPYIVMPAKAPFPNNVTFTGARDYDVDIFFWRGAPFNQVEHLESKVINTLVLQFAA